MEFTVKRTNRKELSNYKTLYIKEYLNNQIDVLAQSNHTSWNNVVISMIEACLNEKDKND